MPGPPLCTTVTPGTRRRALPSVTIWRASSSAPSSTVTLSGVRDSGWSTCAADTTIVSSTARTCSTRVIGSARSVTRCGAAARPGAEARISIGPPVVTGSAKRPSSSVRVTSGAATAPDTTTSARGTGRPSASVTMPLSVPCARATPASSVSAAIAATATRRTTRNEENEDERERIAAAGDPGTGAMMPPPAISAPEPAPGNRAGWKDVSLAGGILTCGSSRAPRLPAAGATVTEGLEPPSGRACPEGARSPITVAGPCGIRTQLPCTARVRVLRRSTISPRTPGRRRPAARVQ